jgi:type IV pilus assembly protein PilB
VVPIGRTLGSVTLAVADPTNLSALDDVAFMTGLKVVPVIAPPSIIHQAIERYYEPAPATLADVLTEVEAESADVEVVAGQETDLQVNLDELRSSADQAPVVRLVNSILLDAIRRGASDIHLDPDERALRIRFRVDGVLHEVMTPPKRIEPAVVSRLKIMASLDIAERRLPQDGRIKPARPGGKSISACRCCRRSSASPSRSASSTATPSRWTSSSSASSPRPSRSSRRRSSTRTG